MAVETGNQLQVAYIAETAFKTTPDTPTGKILRQVGFTLAADRSVLTNPELRTDRQKAPGRGGVMTAKGDLSGVWSFGTYDDFMEAALDGAWTADVLKIGKVRKSFTFERAHLVNGMYFPFRGVVVDSFEISGKADDKVEIKFGLIAAAVDPKDDATIWASTTAPNSNPIATTWSGTIKRNGVSQGAVTSFSIKGSNSYKEAKVCGSKELYDLQMGDCQISGSMDLFFENADLYDDFHNETSVAFEVVIGEGTKTWTLDLSDCRITKFGTPSQGEGMVTVSVEFESYTHATNTALKVTKTAA
jgi:hypothetical protein